MGSLLSSWCPEAKFGQTEFLRGYGIRNGNEEIENWEIPVEQLSEETGFTEAQVVHTYFSIIPVFICINKINVL